jgi:hypothetical protein
MNAGTDTDQGEEVISMTDRTDSRNVTPAAKSSLVGVEALFLETAKAINDSLDLLPPTHPDGPRRMVGIDFGYPEFDPSIFALAGDKRSGRLPRSARAG